MPRIAAGRNAYLRPVAVERSRDVGLHRHRAQPHGHDGRRRDRAVARAGDGDERHRLTAPEVTRDRRRRRTARRRRCRCAPTSSPGRLTAKETLSGSTDVASAEMRTRFVNRSGATFSLTRAAPRRGRSASARNSAADSGGIRSVVRPFASDVVAVAAPSSDDQAEDGVAVCTVTVAGVSDALNAARYSRRAPRSIRLTTSVPSRASRTNEAPVESAGWASRSAPSARRCSDTGCATRSNDEPAPIGAEPTRSSVRHSATAVGKRSWRAALSPPRPIDPDLVAVEHGRRAAQEVEEAVAEQVAGEQLGALASTLLGDLERRPADVVVPEEGHRGRSDTVSRAGSSRRRRGASRSRAHPPSRPRSGRAHPGAGSRSPRGRRARARRRRASRRRSRRPLRRPRTPGRRRPGRRRGSSAATRRRTRGPRAWRCRPGSRRSGTRESSRPTPARARSRRTAAR